MYQLNFVVLQFCWFLKYTVEVFLIVVGTHERDDCINQLFEQRLGIAYIWFYNNPCFQGKVFAQYLVIVSLVDKLVMSWSLFY